MYLPSKKYIYIYKWIICMYIHRYIQIFSTTSILKHLSKSFLVSPTVHIRESSHIIIYIRWGGKMDRQGRNELECYMT